MVIEFFGTQGSGKTTIARELSKRLGIEYIETTGGFQKYKYLFVYIVKSPISFLLLFFKTIKEGGGSIILTRHKLFLLASYVVRASKAKTRGKKRDVILDEGFVQYGLSLHEKKISNPKARSYLKRFLLSDFVIYIDSDLDTRMVRMRDRKRIPRKNLPIDHDKWLARFSENALLFFNIINSDSFNIKIKSLNTTGKSADSCVGEVEGFLKEK